MHKIYDKLKTTAEPAEPDHDHQFVGGTILDGLQDVLGPRRVRRRRYASRPIRSHLEARHRPLQQVSII